MGRFYLLSYLFFSRVLLPIILHILIGWWSVLVLAIVWIILQVPFDTINMIKLMNTINKITEINETFEDNLNMIHEDEQ